MIDTSKIKAGDEVQVDDSPNWREVWVNEPNEIEIYFGDGFLQKIHHDLITDHRPAEPVVPKGEGCVDWNKPKWFLDCDGAIMDTEHLPDKYMDTCIAHGNVSNNRQYLERKRDRQRIEQELLECDGAVYEPVIFTNKNGIETCVGVDRYGCIDFSFLAEVSYRNSVCNFINIETAKSAIEKVGAERIRKAWGLDDDR